MSFVRFFSSVEGRSVTRFGSGVLLGCTVKDGVTEWNTKQVVALTAREWALYGPTYLKHLRAEDIAERTLADYQAQLAEDEKTAPAPETTDQ